MKNIMIIGDSYSTFKGYIPNGYAAYYDPEQSHGIDVASVSDTWWYKLCAEENLNLVLNNSWSGSTVCHTGYNDSDCSKTSSFICRFRKLKADGFFDKNKIDTLFIFGATNESWANVALGEVKLSDFEESDLFKVLPGICYFIKDVRETLTDTRIIYIINTELKEKITNAIITASEAFGTEYLRLDRITKTNGHPTAQGMTEIKEQVSKFIK